LEVFSAEARSGRIALPVRAFTVKKQKRCPAQAPGKAAGMHLLPSD
jgi:hypothetical protein